MKILFIIDKIELKYFEFNKLVTNFWLIKELLERKLDVFISINPNLYLSKNIACVNCYRAFLENKNIFYEKNILSEELNNFDLVFFRPDPPVDVDYINATYVLDFANETKIINSPQAIRNFNEKLHTIYFSNLMPDNIVTAKSSEIYNFLKKHKQIVLKPLNQCFGSGVMCLKEGDLNTKTIIDLMTNKENTMVMVQKFLPNVSHGDCRILTLGDKVLEYSIKKLPGEQDFKFNTHSNAYIQKNNISISEIEKYKDVAIKLNSMGIYMAGLDVIDGQIIEINITSPCYFIQEINELFNVSLEKIICDYVLTKTLISLK